VRKERGKTPSFFGRTSKVKTFFRDRDGEDPDTVAYTEHVPVLFPEPKKEKYDSVAIQKFTDRRRGIIFDRYPTLQTTHIKIQSPILCRELQPLLKPYDVDFEDGYAEIFAPFKPLFFARHEIYRRSRQFDEGTEEREHLDLLLNDVLNEDMWQLIKEVDDLENENKITWPLLWALFFIPTTRMIMELHYFSILDASMFTLMGYNLVSSKKIKQFLTSPGRSALRTSTSTLCDSQSNLATYNKN
jgi:hypothetical protein